MTPIKPMDFAIVINRKKMTDSGLEVGDQVLVAGIKPAPAKRSDPYLQRLYVFVIKIEGDKLLLPKGDNDYKAILVDPRHLEKIEGEELKRLNQLMENQYGNEQ